MKKSFFLFFVLIFGLRISLHADEGMWLISMLNQMNYKQMKEKGLKLTPKQLYDVNHSSLKDAIVMLDHGSCTGEIISNKGLMLTNHHCGFGEIQYHSTVEHDYLTNGFYAKTFEEELPNPGKKASFLVEVKDVTQKILFDIPNDISEEERKEIILKRIKELKENNKTDNQKGEEIMIKSMFAGNQYYMFIYKTYKDVRLVFAPPSSVGKFGGDTDNWMWPRHTGDFSIFRVYTAPDGSPAEYSKDNIPIKSKYFLPVSLKGLEKNDFAMVLGYPGSTNRYLSSYGVDLAINQTNQAIVDIRQVKLDLLKERMNSSKKIKIKYAAKKAQISNYWKYFIGQTKGLKNLNVIDTKRKIEKGFINWINESPKRQEEYKEVIPFWEEGYDFLKKSKISVVKRYILEAIFHNGSQAMLLAWRNHFLKNMLEKSQQIDKNTYKQLTALKERIFKDYDLKTEKMMMSAMLKYYRDKVSKDLHPDIYKKIDEKYKGNIDKFVHKAFKKSVFVSKSKYDKFLKNPDKKLLENDLILEAAASFVDLYNKKSMEEKEMQKKIKVAKRKFIKGLMEMKSANKSFYPDANSTMRITYGNVGGYEANNKKYNYQTYLSGVMEKENPNNDEFIVSNKLKELYKNKDFGQYADKNGKMPVCFLTNNDITGGNSGSPVINGKGELIGLAFDGNWEAMSGDIAFETQLQRCINVDIRYVLFIMDKYYGANRLVNELKIIK